MRPFFCTCFEVIKLPGGDVKALVFDCMQEIFMYNEPNLRRYVTLRRSAKLPVIGTEGVHPIRMRVLPTRFFDNNVPPFFLVLTIHLRFFAIKAASQVEI